MIREVSQMIQGCRAEKVLHEIKVVKGGVGLRVEGFNAIGLHIVHCLVKGEGYLVLKLTTAKYANWTLPTRLRTVLYVRKEALLLF